MSKSCSADVEEYIDGFHKLYGLSGHVKVMEGDAVVFDAHYGYKDYETKEKHSENPQFKVGSISKQFIAASILQLVHKKCIATTDVIGSIFPDFSDALWARDVTIDHLLHHTSGLPSLLPFEADKIEGTGRSFAKNALDLLKIKPLIDSLGYRFHYSNEGYWLLGFLIEHLTQRPLSLYLKENLFDLADMPSTFLMDDSDTIRSLTHTYPYLSLPMECSSDGIISDIDPFLCEGWAAGGIVSTADDLCRWSKALFRDKSILDDAMLSYMTTPTVLGQGCGLVIETLLGGGHIYKHGGAVSGYQGLFEYVPYSGLCIVVLTNLDYPNVTRMEALSLGILEAFVRGKNRNNLNSV